MTDLVSHRRADVARALLDGILLESRRCMSVLEGAGVGVGEIRAEGRMFDSAFVRQQLANALGRQLAIRPAGPASASASSAARGAGLLATAAIAGTDPWAAARESEVELTPPDVETEPLWSELWNRHERLRASMAGSGRGADP